jgi:DNA-binding response OmpR family regulator
MGSDSAQPRMLGRVLIVDDSPLVLEMLRGGLESAGVAVDTANDLSELEARRAASAPDLILLDVQMPEAYGDDVAATLRGVYGVAAPILLMSTIPPEELEQRAKSAGADGWVSKRDGLDRVVSRVLATLARGNGAPP